MMKLSIALACTCLLGACSSAPLMASSINGTSYSSAPSSVSDPRLQHPQFYMDESTSMPWLSAAPHTNR